MKRFVLFATLAMFAFVVVASAQMPTHVRHAGDKSVYYGESQSMAKASGDTIYLIGNPNNPDQVDDLGIGTVENGTFQDSNGNPAWNGWTSQDLTLIDDSVWNVSDFNVVNGNYSFWCGEYFDGDPGYGNNYTQVVLFSEVVADPGVASAVQWDATLNHDSEPGWDYTYFEWNQGGVWQTLATYDGVGTGVGSGVGGVVVVAVWLADADQLPASSRATARK